MPPALVVFSACLLVTFLLPPTKRCRSGTLYGERRFVLKRGLAAVGSRSNELSCKVILSLSDFFALRNQLPVVDVRSENEFAEGNIPGAFNLPILNNEERVAVGTDYKKKGQQEAIRTGFRVVGPRLHEIISKAEEISSGNELIVHCWRGGMRSGNFCQFAWMAGIPTHQLKGGYKTYRTEAIHSFGSPFRFIVLGGFTGSGKSEILRALQAKGEQVIDLESLSNHKGSAFGGLMMGPQPTTEQFQNLLFEEIRKLDLTKRVWVEDESITIGKVVLPEAFWKSLTVSPVVQLDVSKEIRIGRLVKEYGSADPEAFIQAMTSITKKLGGQHFNAAKEKFLNGDLAATMDILLTYYDKAYGFGLARKTDRIQNIVTWNGKTTDEAVCDLIDAVRS